MASLLDSSPQVHRITFRVGRILLPGEQSSSGCYAILSKRTGVVLRISLIREAAELQCDDSRYLAECWVTEVSSPYERGSPP